MIIEYILFKITNFSKYEVLIVFELKVIRYISFFFIYHYVSFKLTLTSPNYFDISFVYFVCESNL